MFGLFRRRWPVIPFAEIRRRSRMLVIDDEEFPYQEFFDRDDYTVEKWDDVQRLSELEDGNFDLILLDLQGVGRKESTEQGFGLLKHLRNRCPAQIIVAYSNADWGLQYQEFFKLADAVLPKSAAYVDFKREVDRLLKERFALGFYVSRIAKEASNQKLDAESLQRAVERAILSRDPSKLNGFLLRSGVDAATIDRILSIANSAIGILSLWLKG